MIKFILLLVCCLSFNANASESVVRGFVDGYKAGTLQFAPEATDNGLPAQSVYDEFFAKTADRKLTLKNVRWNDKRITADLYTTVDGKDTSGSITFWHKDGVISKIIHDRRLWPETNLRLADTGQAADKLSTIVAIAGGEHETNPFLSSLGNAGFIAIGAGVIVARNLIVKDMDLSSCIAVSKAAGGFGWGAAGNNVMVAIGASNPIGWIVGIITGIMTYRMDYKRDCTDGDIRLAEVA